MQRARVVETGAAEAAQVEDSQNGNTASPITFPVSSL
jgi:hypothetical protein